MKHIKYILLAFCLSIATTSFGQSSGKCGDNLFWKIADSTLTITGSGDMYNYASITPWSNYNSKITSVNLPTGLTSIGDEAFRFCGKLTSITIPDSVISIGSQAFLDCSELTSVTIGNSVTSIGDSPFLYCVNLTTMNFNATNCVSMPDVFRGSNLTTLNIGNNVTNIPYHAFSNCEKLTSVTIGNSVTTIGTSAFWKCGNLTEITIPNSVISIGERAFQLCTALRSVIFGDSVTSIGNAAFDSCENLTSIKIPNSITTIGWSSFSRCSSLTEIIIPNSVTSIGLSAFSSSISLTSITIPSSVISIDRAAFSNCIALTSVVNQSLTPQSIHNTVFSSEHLTFNPTIYNNATLYVPAASLALYREAEGWKEFKNIQPIFTEENNEISITTDSLPNSDYGEEYYQTLTATGDRTISWSISSGTLPNGLWFDSATGEISGIPIMTGTFNFTIKASNGSESAEKSFSIIIIPKIITITGITAKKKYDGTNKFSNAQINTISGSINGKLSTDVVSIVKTNVSGTLPSVNAGTSGNLTLSGNFTLSGRDAIHYVLLDQPKVTATITKAAGTFINDSNLVSTTYSEGLKLSDLSLPIGYEWKNPETKILSNKQIQGFPATYTDPSGNYETVSGTITVKVFTPNSIKDILANEISIYPNPVENELFIKSNLQIKKVEIYSLVGDLLLENNFNDKISVSTLSKGVYLLKIYTDKGAIVNKIIKK